MWTCLGCHCRFKKRRLVIKEGWEGNGSLREDFEGVLDQVRILPSVA